MSRNWDDMKPGTFVSVQIAASAYPSHRLRDGSKFITHVARINLGGDVERVCSKIKTESILPDAALFDEYAVDCPACLANLRRLKVSPPQVSPRVRTAK